MRRRVIIALSAAASCLAICVALAWSWATVMNGGSEEILGLFIWTLPLAIAVAVVAYRPRFESRRPSVRVALTTALGIGLSVGMTVLGLLVLGGWMLAWDFPVFFVWGLGSVASTLAAGIAHRTIPASSAAIGFISVVALSATTIWRATRPEPALLVTYFDSPGRVSADLVYDSVLSVPHPSGQGRNLRQGMLGYSVAGSTDSTSRVFLTFERRRDRDAARAALEAHHLVKSVVDTLH